MLECGEYIHCEKDFKKANSQFLKNQKTKLKLETLIKNQNEYIEVKNGFFAIMQLRLKNNTWQSFCLSKKRKQLNYETVKQFEKCSKFGKYFHRPTKSYHQNQLATKPNQKQRCCTKGLFMVNKLKVQTKKL